MRRHVARLLADSKQPIQAAAREAAMHAVSAESRGLVHQWEQKFAAARRKCQRASRAIETIHQETDERARTANAAAAESAYVPNCLAGWRPTRAANP